MTDLKPGWERVKFGDVVRQVKERVDPETAGLTRYIAGEHMDTDDLRIRRWGEIGDGYLGPAFHMHFKPGQVLYGSRRTYLRKVAVPDFEGVCANTTFVLESADPSALLPQLLPFVMQSELFHEHSIRESKGSVNPYVNFSDLSSYVFAIPPLEEQQRRVKVLNAAANLCERSVDLAASASLALRTGMHSLLCEGMERWSEVTLEAMVARFIDYRGRTPSKASRGTPLITAKQVRDGYLDSSEQEWIAETDYERWMTRGIPQTGDTLLTTEAPLGLVARAPSGRFALAQRIICLQPSPQVTSSFLYWTMRGPHVQRELRRHSTGTTVSGVKQATLRTILVRLPSLARQVAIAVALDQLASAMESAQARALQARELFQACLESCLDGANDVH